MHGEDDGEHITEYIADDSDGRGGEGKFRSRGWSVSREEFARLGSVVVAAFVVLVFWLRRGRFWLLILDTLFGAEASYH